MRRSRKLEPRGIFNQCQARSSTHQNAVPDPQGPDIPTEPVPRDPYREGETGEDPPQRER